jgi:predicted nucleic acid-binding protein
VRVLLDTNVILDFFLERDPFFQEANRVFEAIAADQLEGFVSASTVTDIFYICRKQTQSISEAQRIVARVLEILGICPVDRTSLETAIGAGIADFEDAVQLACAMQQQLDAVVTRNPQDFQTSDVPILTVNQLLTQL